MNRSPAGRGALLTLAALLVLLSLGLPIAGSYYAGVARDDASAGRFRQATADRRTQTEILRGLAAAGLKMQRNQLKLCAAARVECER